MDIGLWVEHRRLVPVDLPLSGLWVGFRSWTSAAAGE